MKNKYFLVALIILVLTMPTIKAFADKIYKIYEEDEIYGEYEYYIEDGNAIIRRYHGNDEFLVIPSSINGYPVTRLFESAFENCSSIKSVIIPISVVVIDRKAFDHCLNLESVTIPDSVTSIGERAFLYCKSLTTVTIPKSVTSIGWSAFAYCDNIESANILCDFTSRAMFSGCIALKTVNLSENATIIDLDTFSFCDSLTSIIIPESVTYIAHDAFFGCHNLEEIIFLNPETEFEENSDFSLKADPKEATFFGTDKLSTIYAFSGTKAEKFAIKNNKNFIQIANVSLNGEKLKFDMPPIIQKGRTLVPMRAIFEALGAEVSWDDATQTVTATATDKSITVQIGNPQIQVNGEPIKLDVPPQIVKDRTLVPVRAIGESFGATVDWDDATQTVIINGGIKA